MLLRKLNTGVELRDAKKRNRKWRELGLPDILKTYRVRATIKLASKQKPPFELWEKARLSENRGGTGHNLPRNYKNKKIMRRRKVSLQNGQRPLSNTD